MCRSPTDPVQTVRLNPYVGIFSTLDYVLSPPGPHTLLGLLFLPSHEVRLELLFGVSSPEPSRVLSETEGRPPGPRSDPSSPPVSKTRSVPLSGILMSSVSESRGSRQFEVSCTRKTSDVPAWRPQTWCGEGETYQPCRPLRTGLEVEVTKRRNSERRRTEKVGYCRRKGTPL